MNGRHVATPLTKMTLHRNVGRCEARSNPSPGRAIHLTLPKESRSCNDLIPPKLDPGADAVVTYDRSHHWLSQDYTATDSMNLIARVENGLVVKLSNESDGPVSRNDPTTGGGPCFVIGNVGFGNCLLASAW